jgi:hypothetical protein
MSIRQLTMICAIVILGVASLNAYGWACYDVAPEHVYVQSYTVPGTGTCTGCASEHHWIAQWSWNYSYCTGNGTLDGQVIGPIWGNRYVSLPKSGYFGDECLDGDNWFWNRCDRCEDSTQSCSLSRFNAYCCD